MSTVKVKIDARAGIVEMEGEKDFVQTYLDKLLNVFEKRGLALPPPPAPDLPDGNGQIEVEGDKKPAAKAKRKTNRAPKGESCRDRILILKKDGFFKEKRTPSDIKAQLAKKGWTHATNQITAALAVMFDKAKEIQRTQEDGTFKYYWDRAH